MTENTIPFQDLDEVLTEDEMSEATPAELPSSGTPSEPLAEAVSCTDTATDSGVASDSDSTPDMDFGSVSTTDTAPASLPTPTEPHAPWTHSYSYEELDALLSLPPDQWSRDELTLCGHVLAEADPALADEIARLKSMLVIDPSTVIRNISMKAACTLSPAPDGPVNYVLCEIVALAWCRNISYYMPLQRKDPDTILDFCHLCWEYLQTVQVPDVPSIEVRLVMAARPNGWIGSRSVFMTAEQRNYRYRMVRAPRRSRRLLLIDSAAAKGADEPANAGCSVDTDAPANAVCTRDTDSPQPLPEIPFCVAEPYYTWKQVDDALDLEELEAALERRYPNLHIGAYMTICAADDRLIKTPSSWNMKVARIFFRRRGIRMTPVLLRRWFRACYEAVRFSVRSGYIS